MFPAESKQIRLLCDFGNTIPIASTGLTAGQFEGDEGIGIGRVKQAPSCCHRGRNRPILC
jgi:hypothetical protein